mmetsp:Transcript_5247/g.3965  ORF Transcript_5247/g.3965 Transcript_5247/m.3965 type:complete len:121 (-) Transcript_5247:146-508(-)
MNDEQQLGIGQELGDLLFFFPDFIKMEFFASQGLKVFDAALGSYHTLVLCRGESEGVRVFAFGNGEFGQLGYGGQLSQYAPVEITDKIPGEVVKVRAGAFHSLFLTKDNKLFGCGKNSKG